MSHSRQVRHMHYSTGYGLEERTTSGYWTTHWHVVPVVHGHTTGGISQSPSEDDYDDPDTGGEHASDKKKVVIQGVKMVALVLASRKRIPLFKIATDVLSQAFLEHINRRLRLRKMSIRALPMKPVRRVVTLPSMKKNRSLYEGEEALVRPSAPPFRRR